MKEQSHKEEMSAALRGDFQRLRARGVSASLVPHESPEPGEDAVEEEPPSVVEPSPDATAGPHPEQPPEAEAEEPPARRGWLSRLAGR